MTRVVSVISMKGGVGKTTTTAALGEYLAAAFGKRVLAIDLDAQSNLTTTLLGDQRAKELDDSGNTLANLFGEAIDHEGSYGFDLAKAIQRGASPVRQVKTLDLLPSSLALIDVQERLASMRQGRFYSNNPTDILRRATRPIIGDYDYVLIDCPPSMGMVTLNGLRMSDAYVIPTIPDVMSTHGIPQIRERVSAFADSIQEPIVELGVIVTKYRAASAVHWSTLTMLQSDPCLPRLFRARIPDANQIAAAAAYTEYPTLAQKYGSQRGHHDAFLTLTDEFIEATAAAVAT